MGGGWVLDFARLKLTQPSLAGAGAELGKNGGVTIKCHAVTFFLNF